MKFRTWMWNIAMCLFAALAITLQLSAQDNRDHQPTIITFDAPGAGTGAGQGTFAGAIIPAGTIAGYYTDSNSVGHGYVRTADGTITTFDAPGAGTSPGQGTFLSLIGDLNPEGAITGWYYDGNNVSHGFLRAPDGTMTTFDVPQVRDGSLHGASQNAINPAGAITGNYLDKAAGAVASACS